MAKDEYSGAPRKASGARRGTRDRLLAPHMARSVVLAGNPPPKDADDALSTFLVKTGAIAPRGKKAVSTIRNAIRSDMQGAFSAITRQGESELDAANAIRARFNQRQVPAEFTLSKAVRGRASFGTMTKGTRVKVRGAKIVNGRLKIVIAGRTPGGRYVTQDIDEEIAGSLF